MTEQNINKHIEIREFKPNPDILTKIFESFKNIGIEHLEIVPYCMAMITITKQALNEMGIKYEFQQKYD